MQDGNNCLLQVINDAGVNYFNDLFENLRDLNMIMKNTDKNANKRIQNFSVLDSIEQGLNKIESTLHKYAIT